MKGKPLVLLRAHRVMAGVVVLLAAIGSASGFIASASNGASQQTNGIPTKLTYLAQHPKPPTTTNLTTGPPPTVPDPWLAYRSAVDPGPAIHFVTAEVGWRLNVPEISPGIDSNLASGPNGSTKAVPGNSIAASGDGGTSWHTILADATGLWGFDLLSTSIGWAVGVTSLQLTTDGGTSWQQRFEPTGTHLVAVDFVSPTVGFGLTTSGQLVETASGGESWSNSSLSETGSAECFASAQVGYVADGSGDVFSTADGGGTWTETRDTSGFPASSEWPSLACSGSDAWLLNTEVLPGHLGTYVLQTTSDGGASWTVTAANDSSLASLAGVPTPLSHVEGIATTADGTGYAVGFPASGWALSAVVMNHGTPRSYVSYNLPAPQASSQIPTNSMGYVHILGVTFDGATGWLSLDDSALGTSTSAATERWGWEILKTTTGGRSWSLLATSGPQPIT